MSLNLFAPMDKSTSETNFEKKDGITSSLFSSRVNLVTFVRDPNDAGRTLRLFDFKSRASKFCKLPNDSGRDWSLLESALSSTKLLASPIESGKVVI